MTTQEQLAFIKSRCIAANKSILDLKFGCRIQNNWTDGKNPIFISTYIATMYKNGGKQYRMIDDDGDFFTHNVSEKTEIIGRPIRLADILYAIGKTDNELFYNHNYKGLCIRYNDYRTKNGVSKSETWDLLNDTIDNQSPELIAFVAKILAVT